MAGRPSKYKKRYCDELIDYFKDESVKPLPLFEDFAQLLDIAKSTLYKWGEQHPEFSDALKRAKEIQESRWIKGALDNKFNVTFAIFMGKNNFGWKDRTATELTGKDGGPVEARITDFPPEVKTVEEWLALKDKMVKDATISQK